MAITLNGFSQIMNVDLARDLGPEVIRALTHSRAHIRKRAVVALYRILVKQPELSESAVPRLRERLEDDDLGMFISVWERTVQTFHYRRRSCRRQCTL